MILEHGTVGAGELIDVVAIVVHGQHALDEVIAGAVNGVGGQVTIPETSVGPSLGGLQLLTEPLVVAGDVLLNLGPGRLLALFLDGADHDAGALIVLQEHVVQHHDFPGAGAAVHVGEHLGAVLLDALLVQIGILDGIRRGQVVLFAQVLTVDDAGGGVVDVRGGDAVDDIALIGGQGGEVPGFHGDHVPQFGSVLFDQIGQIHERALTSVVLIGRPGSVVDQVDLVAAGEQQLVSSAPVGPADEVHGHGAAEFLLQDLIDLFHHHVAVSGLVAHHVDNDFGESFFSRSHGDDAQHHQQSKHQRQGLFHGITSF